ncbi:hypothetical protein [Salinibacter phage M8CRM-1]|uniref:Uncharacterized protein n=3 Tax=Kryptosalinivirus TaxID=2560163 RepID=A0A2I6UGH1_9CAUD|nr:hypothetical protein FGG63_gp24 [Salinibacter phage M8CC-19]YP_009639491.1 hypothetical protein FGG67_gp25 [Salinibacter phage M8CRM-1]AUO79007.1 hypothetical protein [Salinibacter phage M8CC-19]AUO79168.1 hypothetical protein [Salinibacter phage M8CRM-1]AUO79240.1 hypothetical protein [Salinibacter phage M31CC-1]
MGADFRRVAELLGPMNDDSGGTDVKYPPWARVLKAKLRKNTDTVDWMLAGITDHDPLRAKEIKKGCTLFEITQMYAMKVYSNSAEPK